MYELIKISEHDYYIDCPAKVGVVLTEENSVVLIDSGSDKDAAKKVFRCLEENGWKLEAIYNTHSHADHIGGNKFLQEKTGCSIYAPGLDCTYTNVPQLESMGLYGGLPFKDIQNKFLMAQPSMASLLVEDILPAGWKILNLPGHCFDMVGFITADGNAFVADSVSSDETLAKYGMAYLWDPIKSLETLEFLKTIEAKQFVPAHAALTTDISYLADVNAKSINSVINVILGICKEPSTFECILRKLFDAFSMTLNTQQYLLIGGTLRSYLSALYTQGKLTFEFADNQMFWRVVG